MIHIHNGGKVVLSVLLFIFLHPHVQTGTLARCSYFLDFYVDDDSTLIVVQKWLLERKDKPNSQKVFPMTPLLLQFL